jgi:hypothetical protein
VTPWRVSSQLIATWGIECPVCSATCWTASTIAQLRSVARLAQASSMSSVAVGMRLSGAGGRSR